jgi:RNA polymerase sigma-70 factor, ECF subfamily
MMHDMTRPTRSQDSRDAALEHWPFVVAFGRQLTGATDAAEDLAQEAYLRFFAMNVKARPPDANDPRGSRALLFTIVLNLVRSASRRRIVLELDEDVATTNGDPAALASTAEEKVRLERALAALQPAWRAALFLADGLDCSYAEVARVLSTSDDVVRTTLHRARKKLREMLERGAEAKANRGER